METSITIKSRNQLGELLEHFGLSGHAVEIGCAEGLNAAMLIQQPAITQLYMIDAWQRLEQKGDGGNPQSWHDRNYKEALERTENYSDKRVVLRGLSSEMILNIPDDSLILAYVDGDHSFRGCLNDLLAIWPKIKVGGILAGHDILNESYGVKRAVATFIAEDTVKQTDVDKILIVNIIEEDEPVNASFWIRKK